MEQKLFELTFTAYVVGIDEQAALQALIDECIVSVDSGMSLETHEAGSVAAEWYDQLPFGSNDGITCGEIVMEAKE